MIRVSIKISGAAHVGRLLLFSGGVPPRLSLQVPTT